jgi:polar amino acid transport system substrate-binding protein
MVSPEEHRCMPPVPIGSSGRRACRHPAVTGDALKEEKKPLEVTPAVLKDLAPGGTLYAAINTGNPVLVQQGKAGELSGVTVDLSHEMGRLLDVPIELVPYSGAGKVFEAAGSGAWNVAFLAIDPERSRGIRFTEPYVIIEGTCIVRSSSQARTLQDLDRPGMRISVVKGAAYDLYLTRTLKHAQLLRKSTFEEQMDLFVSEELEASAGVRQPLEAFARDNKGYRVFEGRFTEIRQAMGIPQGRKAGSAWVDEFLDEMKRSGYIEQAFARAGQLGVTLVPAKKARES